MNNVRREMWCSEREEKICAIDIDGCIVDYPKNWVDYANKKLKTNYKSLYELKEKTFFNQYKRLKKEFRETGQEAIAPIKEDAKKMIDVFRADGFKVILLTARPYREHRRIWKDTMDWLKSNKIEIDGIIFDKEKHLAVIREFPYLKFMVEDNAEIANQVARLGYKTYVVDNPYNQQPLERNCFRVMNLLDICKNEVVK